jgi:membrane associated rhomboid family serine protease
MQLELTSVFIMAIIAVVGGIMLSGRANSILTLAVGLVITYLVSDFFMGSNIYIVWNELGFKTVLYSNVDYAFTLISSVFLHKDPVHLMSNILFLVLAGYPMSRRVEPMVMMSFMIFGTILGTIMYSITMASTPQILIGASILVSCIIGAMTVMYPTMEIDLPGLGETRLEIWMICVIWVMVQAFQAFGIVNATSNVAYLGHLYGFIIGVVLGAVSKSNKSPWSLLKADDQYIDITLLEPLCVTDQQRALYNKAIANDDPVFRDAWARYLIRYIPCPNCGREFRIVGSSFVCPNGHIMGEMTERNLRRRRRNWGAGGSNNA